MLRSFRRIASVVVALSALAAGAGAEAADFGDAPDGRAGGRFPSLLSSDGARTDDVAVAWIGPRVDVESDSLQVDRDRFDDGVTARLESCRTSTAFVEVDAAAASGAATAYLNLFVDWNRDGAWGGSDACAPEWRVRNLPIDLAAQAGTSKIYAVTFRAGREVRNVWLRAILSVDRRWENETGAGAFPRGEVEDHLVPDRGRRLKRFGARCAPNPLAMKHGETRKITVLAKPGSVPVTDVGLGNSTPGFSKKGKGKRASNRRRDVLVVGNVLTFTSKRVHGPPHTEREILGVRVRFGTVGSIVLACEVRVIHDQPQRVMAAPEDCTLTGASSEWLPQLYGTTPTGGSTVFIRGRVDVTATAWKSQCGVADGPPSGIRIVLPPGLRASFAHLVLGDPANPASPQLSCDNSVPGEVRCPGSEPLPSTFFFDLFADAERPPNAAEPLSAEIVSLHLIALRDSTALGAIESRRKRAP